MKVLVVDSDEARRAAVTQTLRAGGVEVSEAPSGSFALTMLEWNRHDVILSRSRTDDMDGLELCGILRADPATRELRFVLMAAEGETVSPDTSGVDLVLADGMGEVAVLPMVVQLMRRVPQSPPTPAASVGPAPAKAPAVGSPPVTPLPVPLSVPVTVPPPVAVPAPIIVPSPVAAPAPIIVPPPIAPPAPAAVAPIVPASPAAATSFGTGGTAPLITPGVPKPTPAKAAPVISIAPVPTPPPVADPPGSGATGRNLFRAPAVAARPAPGAPLAPPPSPAEVSPPTLAAPGRLTAAPVAAARTPAPAAPAPTAGAPALGAPGANSTPRPARAAIDIPARTFQGSLSVMEMEELVQAIAVGHKTGRLLIVVAAGGGMIAFEDGRVIHAEFGKRSGTEAFEALVTSAHREGSGKFCFIPGDSTTLANLPRTISASTEQLMLTIAAAMDEKTR